MVESRIYELGGILTMLKLQDYIYRIQCITAKRCPRLINGKGEPQPWQVLARQQSKDSIDIALVIPNGYSTQDLRQETDSISAAVGQIISITDHRGAAVITIHLTDFPDKIIGTDDMITSIESKRQILLGFDRKRTPIYHDFRVPHMMIAGMSGYGKTDLIRWIIYQLISRHTPQQLSIDIIDGKGFSFLPFRNIPHITRIGRDLPSAADILTNAHNLMTTRSNLVWNASNREETSLFQWKIIIIDEAAQIAPSQHRNPDHKKLALIADSHAAAISCVGREARVGLLYCTQRPDANIINPQVKANMEATFGFRTKTVSNSEIIIDRPGLEKLPIGKPGRGVYAASEDIILQVPFIGDDKKWDEILQPYKQKETTNNEDDPTNPPPTEYFGDLD